MIRRLLWPVLFMVVLGSGCVGTSSLNVERSALRGTGDTGITMVLENQDEADVPGVAKGVKDICNDVLNFLDTGRIAELTKSELKAALLRVVPKGSKDFVNDMLSLVSVTRVNTSAVGARNIKRIRAFVKGVVRGADEYDVGDRE